MGVYIIGTVKNSSVIQILNLIDALETMSSSPFLLDETDRTN